MYIVLWDPILECWIMIMNDNCTHHENDYLEIVVARIVTGATKLISIENLYWEIGGDPSAFGQFY